MKWERVMRMLRLRSIPFPDLSPNPDLGKARQEVEELHRKADRVLEEYALAEQARR